MFPKGHSINSHPHFTHGDTECQEGVAFSPEASQKQGVKGPRDPQKAKKLELQESGKTRAPWVVQSGWLPGGRHKTRPLSGRTRSHLGKLRKGAIAHTIPHTGFPKGHDMGQTLPPGPNSKIRGFTTGRFPNAATIP